MIELTTDESMLLALTKGWEHIEVPVERNEVFDVTEDRMDYIQRVCAHRCGCPIRRVDIWGIYSTIAEKVLTSRDLLRAFEYCTDGYHTWTVTPIEAIISALANVKVKNSPDDIIIKMDMSEVISMVERTQELKDTLPKEKTDED